MMRLALCLGAIGAGVAWAQTSMRFTEIASGAGVVHTFSPRTDFPGQHERMVGGLSVGDFNRDGWPDILALGGGNTPHRLFINRGGTFTDEAAAWGAALLHRGAAVAVGDVNGDGFDDAFVVGYGDTPAAPTVDGCRLLLNRGGTRFDEVAGVAGVRRVSTVQDGLGAVFGDVDRDGDLDLFVCSWNTADGGNRLFRNDGNDSQGVPRFTDVTAGMGASANRVQGFTPRLVDLNGDLYPELLIAGDFSTSRLFVNLGPDAAGQPRFVDVTDNAGVVHDTNAMGTTLGDIDFDGDLDWFITNIRYTHNNYSNTMYLNGGINPTINAPAFSQGAFACGVHDAGWGWGTVFGDFDHDLDLDLAATGGWDGFPATPARLYQHPGPGATPPLYQDVAAASGFTFTGLGRTLVTLDFDRDGDLDLAMSATNSPLRLFRNDTPANGRSSIMLDLVSQPHPCLPPNGRHARVEADVGGLTLLRVQDGGPTYLGQSEDVVHIGLGMAAQADEVRITWPDGRTQRLGPVPAGVRMTVVATHPADPDRDGVLGLADVVRFSEAFAAADLGVADVAADGLVDINDLLVFADAFITPCPR